MKGCVREVSLAQVSCILMYVYVAPPTPVGAWSMALGRFEYYCYCEKGQFASLWVKHFSVAYLNRMPLGKMKNTKVSYCEPLRGPQITEKRTHSLCLSQSSCLHVLIHMYNVLLHVQYKHAGSHLNTSCFPHIRVVLILHVLYVHIQYSTLCTCRQTLVSSPDAPPTRGKERLVAIEAKLGPITSLSVGAVWPRAKR